MPRKKKGDRSRANGEGTVYAFRGKWRWQFQIPGSDPPARIGGVCPTREEASLKLMDARVQHARGTLRVGPASQATFADAAARYLARPRGWSASTLARYTTLMGYATDYFGTRTLVAIQTRDVRDFVAHVAAQPSRSTRNRGETLSLQTVAVALWLVSCVLTEAASEGLIPANPALAVRPPRPGRDDSELEVRRVLDLPEADRFVRLGSRLWQEGLAPHWPALYTILSLGLRRGEAAGLRWTDVDLPARRLHVRQSRNYLQRNTPPKTRSSRRSLPLPESVAGLLSSLPREGEPVFSPQYLDPNLYSRALASLLKWSDPERLDENLRGAASHGVYPAADLPELILSGSALPNINVHGLRHTYATLSLRRGVPIEVVSKTLGHAKISMTFDVYRHVLDSEWQERSVDLFASSVTQE